MSSKGSDGHSLAITAGGQVFSWGDGKIVGDHWIIEQLSVLFNVLTCKHCAYDLLVVGILHCAYMHVQLYQSWSDYCLLL